MKLRIQAVLAALVLALGLGAWAAPDQGGDQTLTGVISDSMCGAKHMMQGSAADCTRACVKQGGKYALVVGDKVYTLDGNKDELDKFAGQRVTVTGTVSGDTVHATSVKGS